MKKIKNWYLNKKTSFISKKTLLTTAIVGLSYAALAEGESSANNVQSLWTALGLDFKDFFEKTFAALSTPVGVILAVVFVMCIFYLCVRMAARSISPSKRV